MKPATAAFMLAAALLLAVAAPARCDPPEGVYEALLEHALGAVTWDFHDEWAFTETETGSDGEFVGRHDPRKPVEARWTLLAIDGRAPTAAESRQYADRKRGETGDDEHGDQGDIGGMIAPGSLQLIEETGEHWLLGFVPAGDSGDSDDDDDEMGRRVLARMDGTVKIVKDGRYLEYIDIRNTKPIRPKAGVKMKEFLTRITFGPAVEGGPIVMQSIDVAIKLSAFLVVRVDETESVRFSDFEYAGDAG